MKPATPSTLRPANGGATQDGKTELPPSTQLRKVVFGGTRFSLFCAASKKQFPVRTTCIASLLPLLLLTLPAVVQAQFNYTTNNGTITITGYTGPGGAVAIPAIINGLLVTRIEGSAFYNQTSLTNVTIPNSVTSIGDSAFSGCTSLTSVTIPNSVTTIGEHAFLQCYSLTSVTIPNSVNFIGDGAFVFCTNLTSVTIGNSVTSIGDGAFSFCTSLTGVTIPNSVTSIGGGAFVGCTSLTSVAIPNSVTSSIGGEAFAFCTSLTSVTIGNSVTSIGDGAFGGCTNLTSVTIPNSVTSIGGGAFGGCTSLISVTIPNSVTSIGSFAFSGCTGLSAITVEALNSFYISVDGVLFNNSQTTLIQYPGGKAGSYTIPNSVTSIEGGAFYGCTSLTSVTIGNSVTSMGHSAFYGCTSLTSITIPNSFTSIGDSVFYGCTRLTAVYFKGNTPSLSGGGDVFTSSDNATVYYLPETTGWGTTFAGRPAVLWNPRVRTSDASFGVRTNRFGFTITGANNLVIVVEASTNLASPIWTSVGTNTLTGSSSYFSDPQWTNHPARFYRLRSP